MGREVKRCLICGRENHNSHNCPMVRPERYRLSGEARPASAEKKREE